MRLRHGASTTRDLGAYYPHEDQWRPMLYEILPLVYRGSIKVDCLSRHIFQTMNETQSDGALPIVRDCLRRGVRMESNLGPESCMHNLYIRVALARYRGAQSGVQTKYRSPKLIQVWTGHAQCLVPASRPPVSRAAQTVRQRQRLHRHFDCPRNSRPVARD